MLALIATFIHTTTEGVGSCPAAPPAYTRTMSACTSTSSCTAPHCNCDATVLAEGACTTTLECTRAGSYNCTSDSRCHSFSVRSDCSTKGTASAVRWMSHREGCNKTVPNTQWVTYSSLNGPPCPPTPTLAPTIPPLLPKWKPTWDMMRSTMLYTCNHSGFHNATYAAQFGVVSYDWSNAKEVWAQAHPMTCEEMLTEQAELVLALDAGIPGEQPRVWVYRNTIKALNWFKSVRVKLDDPAYGGWFVRFANYTGGNGSYHVPACTFEKCSGFYHDQKQTPEMGGGSHNGGCNEECDCGDAPCGEYVFDHRNTSFSDWFVNEWMISASTLKHTPHPISLAYLDDWMQLGGPTEMEGHFVDDTGSTSAEMAAHVEAYLRNMKRLEQALVDHGGFWQGLVNHGAGDQTMSRGPQIRPIGKDCYHDCGNVTAPQCEAILRDVWCVPDPAEWKRPMSYLMRPPSERNTRVAHLKETQATAQFLLTRGPFAWIGFFDWQSLANWPRPKEWDTDFGTPDGPCAETEVGSGVFARSWSKATVTWDCATAKGEITMK